jgi:hypothetical protein
MLPNFFSTHVHHGSGAWLSSTAMSHRRPIIARDTCMLPERASFFNSTQAAGPGPVAADCAVGPCRVMGNVVADAGEFSLSGLVYHVHMSFVL